MTKNIFSVFVVVIAGVVNASAQITFQKTYGGIEADNGSCVRQTADLGYVVLGSTASFGAGSDDVYLIKTDMYGDTLWTKTYGGINSDYGNTVQPTSDGGYIIAGVTNSFGAGNYDLYLIKTDSVGNLIWNKTYGGPENELYPGFVGYEAVVQELDAGYVIAGTTESFGAGFSDVYLVRVNEYGDTLWTKTFGGLYDEFAYAIQKTNDGGFIISGSTDSYISLLKDAFLIKTDSNGNLSWTRSISVLYGDEFFSVQQTSDGGYIVCGYTSGFNGVRILCLTKVDDTGNVVWTETLNGIEGNCVQQTSDGGFIVSGLKGGASLVDVLLLKTDSSGTPEWLNTFGGVVFDGALSIRQTIDGGFILAGQTKSFDLGEGDIYLIKTDSLGNGGCNQTTFPANPFPQTATELSPAPELYYGGSVATPTSITSSGTTITSLCEPVTTIEEEIIYDTLKIFPNPISSAATITFSLRKSEGVSLKVFDIAGRCVATIADEKLPEGYQQIKWNATTGNGSAIASGMYLLKFESENSTKTIKFSVAN